MSAKAIRELSAKTIIVNQLASFGCPNVTDLKAVQVTPSTNYDHLLSQHPWLATESLVAKPDQLIKRRGKLGLVKVKASYEEVKAWISQRMEKPLSIGECTGILNNFIIEPFCAHEQRDEFYVSIYSVREGHMLLFYEEGGVDVGDVDAKAQKYLIRTNEPIDLCKITEMIVRVDDSKKKTLAKFLTALFELYMYHQFTYLEINPFVIVGDIVYILDVAAKLDECANFEYASKLPGSDDAKRNRDRESLEYPAPFGREMTREESFISDLDSKTGASLKLTVLNAKGRVWTMVAGGGASVIYADTVCDLGFASELANYGEYSGAPTDTQTYLYAKTLLDLMTRESDPQAREKILLIGGGIANFTNIALTFKGLIKALREFDDKLVAVNARIYVRRAGPNYQEGLSLMRQLDREIQTPIEVFGPETHMTAIVSMALGIGPINERAPLVSDAANDDVFMTEDTKGAYTETSADRKRFSTVSSIPSNISNSNGSPTKDEEYVVVEKNEYNIFTRDTTCIVYGLQSRAVQGMLDFDFVCSRKVPSVSCIIYPFGSISTEKFYWGTKEILIPVFPSLLAGLEKFPKVDVLVNFTSFRSAFESTMEVLDYSNQIKVVAIIAEGIPELRTKMILEKAKAKSVTIIGPATVGGIKPGCFRIGNTGGMMDNILSSKLYRPGSVGYVSRSGGMSNELNNIISRNSDGVFEGVAIGGDRFPGTTFYDHVLRYQNQAACKMIVVLGEVGGDEEYKLCEAIKNNEITKPIICWCIGTCSSLFTSEVQFGHAGSFANAARETSVAKNKALKDAGAIVPTSFDTLDKAIQKVYLELVGQNIIHAKPEAPRPKVPIDYKWAQELGLIRKPTSFMTSISDERGDELIYGGIPISQVINDELGIGGVMSLLWMKKRLPEFARKFLELCVVITADHGPAVSGAHNTIVAARAAKDLVSSVASGLLCIGDRFGGALDDAAKQFTFAVENNLSPQQFVNHMRDKKLLISGIGHRVKSINNPDKRVELLKKFIHEHFPATPFLDYGIKVEQITTSKRANLILNVDGCIGLAMVDLLRSCDLFTPEEAEKYIDMGLLNALFVFGRTLGFIGHFLDQKRLNQGLYRHPWDDISYIMNEDAN